MFQLGLSPHFHQLDIDSQDSIDKFAAYIKNTYGGLDVLVNNAAIAYKVRLRLSYSYRYRQLQPHGYKYRSLFLSFSTYHLSTDYTV